MTDLLEISGEAARGQPSALPPPGGVEPGRDLDSRASPGTVFR